jgi:hypothetical protein
MLNAAPQQSLTTIRLGCRHDWWLGTSAAYFQGGRRWKYRLGVNPGSWPGGSASTGRPFFLMLPRRNC